jgi:hypothetical protein
MRDDRGVDGSASGRLLAGLEPRRRGPTGAHRAEFGQIGHRAPFR